MSTWEEIAGETSPHFREDDETIPGFEYYHIILAYKGLSPVQYKPQHGCYDKKGPIMSSYGAGKASHKTEEGTPETVYKRAVLKWTSKQDVLNAMGQEEKKICNSVKALCGAHPVAVWFHNSGPTDFSCVKRKGGPHLHIIMKSEVTSAGHYRPLNNITRVKTLRKTCEEVGGYLSQSGVKYLDRLIYYLLQRIFLGTSCGPVFREVNKCLNDPAKADKIVEDMWSVLENDTDVVGDDEECEWTGFEEGDSPQVQVQSGFRDDGCSAPPVKKRRIDDIDVNMPENDKAVTLEVKDSEKLCEVTEKLCLIMNAYNMKELHEAFGKLDLKSEKNRRLKSIWRRLQLKYQVERWVKIAKNSLEGEYMHLSFNALIGKYCERVQLDDQYESPKQSYLNFVEWMGDQNLDPLTFINIIWEVMDRHKQKKNSICMVGPPNSGKTQMFQMPLCAIAKFVGRLLSRSGVSEFKFQEMLNKRLISIDECILDPRNIEEMKQLLGGEELTANVKKEDGALVKRTPCILTGNKEPWVLDVSAAAPFMTRMHYYTVKPVPGLEAVKRMSPKMYWYLMQCHEKQEMLDDIDLIDPPGEPGDIDDMDLN